MGWIDRAKRVDWQSAARSPRYVTLLEVFCRYWVQKLIDSGSPYVERAVGLKADVKYDLALVRSLHGQTISLGLLLSNSVSLSNIDSISAALSILVEHDFFDWLSKVKPRTLLEDGGAPIVADVQTLRRVLSRTFEVRHVLVHEFPEASPHAIAEVDEMIAATDTFIHAADEGFAQLLYGLYPISQQAMNRAAREESSAAQEELQKLIDEVQKRTRESDILQVQQAWDAFAKAEAERHAKGWTGGTGYPLIYHTALKVLTRDRVNQLRLWVDEMFDHSD
jgi:uncharacterized protein YecT (DUF1311 family)